MSILIYLMASLAVIFAVGYLYKKFKISQNAKNISPIVVEPKLPKPEVNVEKFVIQFVVYNNGGNGRIIDSNNVSTTTFFIKAGPKKSTISMTALPYNNSKFLGWSSSNSTNNIFSTDNNLTYIINQEEKVFAIFGK